MDPITLALLALGGMALVGGKSRSRIGRARELDRFGVLNEIRKMSIHYSDSFESMPHLSMFMIVTGFRESNFNPSAINSEIKTNPNAARGLFGLRPETVFKKANDLEDMLRSPNALLHPRWSFICAVFHVWTACSRLNKKGFVPNYAAIRRWWGSPTHVYDYDLESDYSRENLSRFQKAIADCNRLYGTGLDPDFIWEPILGWENYPGMKVMLQVYGLA